MCPYVVNCFDFYFIYTWRLQLQFLSMNKDELKALFAEQQAFFAEQLRLQREQLRLEQEERERKLRLELDKKEQERSRQMERLRHEVHEYHQQVTTMLHPSSTSKRYSC